MSSFESCLKIIVLIAISAALDMFRAFFVESVKTQYRKRLESGTFKNVLAFEKYLQFELKEMNKEDLSSMKPDNIFTFFDRGQPQKVSSEYFFCKLADIHQPDKNTDNFPSKSIENQILLNTSDDFSSDLNFSNETEEEIPKKYSKTHIDPNLRANFFKIVQKLPKNIPAEMRLNHKFVITHDLDKLKKIHEKFPVNCKITRDTLENVYGKHNKNDIEMVFEMLSYDTFEDITWNHFKWNFRQINLERDSLYVAIKDSKELTIKLSILSTMVLIIIMLSLMNFVITFDLPYLRIPAPVMLFAFLLVVKDAFGSFLFILFSHPFISGDRIMINDEAHIVHRINIFCSVFYKWNGEKVYISNKWLADHPVRNIRKSKVQKWELILLVSNKTTNKQIEELKEFLKKLKKLHRKYFFSITVDVIGLENSNKMKMIFYVTHKTNFQIGFYRWNRHQFFMSELLKYLNDKKVEYVPLEIPLKIDGMDMSHQFYRDMIELD